VLETARADSLPAVHGDDRAADCRLAPALAGLRCQAPWYPVFRSCAGLLGAHERRFEQRQPSTLGGNLEEV
jgi:hypothetical protein